MQKMPILPVSTTDYNTFHFFDYKWVIPVLSSSPGYFRANASAFSCIRAIKSRYSVDSGLKGRWANASLTGRHSSRNCLVVELKNISANRCQMYSTA